jgi:hypothetical protein
MKERLMDERNTIVKHKNHVINEAGNLEVEYLKLNRDKENLLKDK